MSLSTNAVVADNGRWLWRSSHSSNPHASSALAHCQEHASQTRLTFYVYLTIPASPGPAFVPILRNLTRRFDVVLRRCYTLLKGLRSADFSIAYVSCKERRTSTVRMEASMGSLKVHLSVISRFCEPRKRRRHAVAYLHVGGASKKSYGRLLTTSLGYPNMLPSSFNFSKQTRA